MNIVIPTTEIAITVSPTLGLFIPQRKIPQKAKTIIKGKYLFIFIPISRTLLHLLEKFQSYSFQRLHGH